MNVLVAGGAGYIGSVLAGLLLERGHAVTVYDNLIHGYRDAVPPGAHWVEGDVGDEDKLRRLLLADRIEGVVHMAAFIEVGESVRDPHKYLENNTLRALALLHAMECSGVRRLVLSSTAAVYAPSSTLLSESSPLGPVSPYGLSKLFLERLLAWYASRGLHYFALRYFNAAGATALAGERHQPESHLIPLILQAAAGERDSITVFGADYPTPDGTCIRDYVHVLDLAQAHLLALDILCGEPEMPPGVVPELSQRAFNLGNGGGFSVREVLAAAERVCDLPIPFHLGPRRPGDPARLVADAARIRALGWHPQITGLDAIIASAWNWKRRSHLCVRPV